jgi:hypothetical protein
MREVNLALFDFDYDLTWMAFFLSPQEKIYGRYGGRDAVSADSQVSLAGLAYAMDSALCRHQVRDSGEAPARPGKFSVRDFAAFSRLPANACVHCHQVYDLRRESLQIANKWSLDEVWVYPQPENIGLTLDVNRGNYVRLVAASSAAERAGIRPGDRVTRIEKTPIASIADVQYALHRQRTTRRLEVSWQRESESLSATLELAADWHKTDLSWRWSLRGIGPEPPLRGDDLSIEERSALGLAPKRLAFRQGPFVAAAAEQAGVHQNDIVVGIDNHFPDMSFQQFAAHIRLNYEIGRRVTFNLMRAGKRFDVTLTLTGRGQ